MKFWRKKDVISKPKEGKEEKTNLAGKNNGLTERFR